MQCAESLRLQAYFDAEADAVSAAEIERHLEHCAECRALLADLGQLRAVLRRDVTFERAPPLLRARLARALDQETKTRRPKARATTFWRAASFWAGAAGGIGGTAIAATVAFLLLAPPLLNPLVNDLVSAHARSLMPEHLIDVISTDKHTVKPWFAGHADVSPVVADFESQGDRKSVV